MLGPYTTHQPLYYYCCAMHSSLAKYMWYKSQNIYKGDDKVKKEKLKIHRGQFESLKMK